MKSVNKVTKYILDEKFKYISRFSIVGVINTLIDFLVFTIFNEVFSVGYTISQVLGYCFGVANSFIFNKKWTFQQDKSNKKILYEVFQFIIVNLVSLTVTVMVMNLLAKNLNVNVYAAKIIVTLIAQIINFLSYKFLVFS